MSRDLKTTRAWACLEWGPKDSPVALVLPAGSSVTDAADLARCLVETIKDVTATVAAYGTGGDSESTFRSLAWLSEIAHGLMQACTQVDGGKEGA